MAMAEIPPKPLVLVADDESSVRDLVCRILRDVGWEVDSAVDGRDALDKMEKRRPHLLVLDLMMPELDGWGVLDKLRESDDAPPVLLLTARSDYPTFTRAVRDGATAYIAKPFRLQELITACRKLLEAAAREPEPVGSERRRQKRREFLVEVRVSSKLRAPVAFGEVINLSAGGAQLDLDAPLTPGDEIRIAFHTPGGGGPLDLDCEVLWWRGSASKRVSHGLRFRNLSSEDQRHLRDLVGED
jgi:DNA-binding response OmpR family regulator